MKSCDAKLVLLHTYEQMMQGPDKYDWVKYTQDSLCFHDFVNVWRDQYVMNEKILLANFEQRLKDTFIQKLQITQDLRTYYTTFRLSSHTFLVDQAR